ncbi:V-type proton ATPasesubunit a [Trichinella spiralis]|uniref:V-type proton ATPasesubunit a n=1 Tax=Trichinella spiralis TaxID=6334 RepID=A0ABR3KD98_TRISP
MELTIYLLDNFFGFFSFLCSPGESSTWYEWIVTPLLLLCCQVLKAWLPLPGAPNYICFGRLFPLNYLTRWTETRTS